MGIKGYGNSLNLWALDLLGFTEEDLNRLKREKVI